MNPNKTGTFVIQPITVTIDGKTYSTEPITLRIKEPSAAPTEPNPVIFAQTTVSNDKPYVNEQVVLTLKLFRRVDVKNINLGINYDGFRKEDLGKDKEYNQVMNGINYRVHELAVAIFPTKAGTIEIPPATLELDVLTRGERRPSSDPFAHFFDDSFFFGGRVQAEHKVIRTNPLILKVHVLPESGKPTNFSNLVGQFSIFASMGKDEVDVGDSTTLTVTVSGKGNARDIPEPKLELRDNFKSYPDQPEFTQEMEGNKIGGKKIFKFAVVPLREGKAAIPSIHLTYFDPDQKKYIDKATNPLTIRVKPPKTKEQLNTVEADDSSKKLESKAIKIIGKDILPIHTNIFDFKNSPLVFPKFALISLVSPAILYFVTVFYLRHKYRLQYDVAYSRKRVAYKQAKKRLNAIAIHTGNSKEFAGELSKILREYIGDKINLHGTAFTSREMEAILKERNYREDLIQTASGLLEKCESLQYAPVPVNGNLTATLLDESSDLLEKLEKQK